MVDSVSWGCTCCSQTEPVAGAKKNNSVAHSGCRMSVPLQSVPQPHHNTDWGIVLLQRSVTIGYWWGQRSHYILVELIRGFGSYGLDCNISIIKSRLIALQSWTPHLHTWQARGKYCQRRPFFASLRYIKFVFPPWWSIWKGRRE
jgi:hypothetical protein